ncbi:MAG: hypothetical protein LBD79_02140 [Treponema sp.]|nr:hypothetical protein [Treponema sp.]
MGEPYRFVLDTQAGRCGAEAPQRGKRKTAGGGLERGGDFPLLIIGLGFGTGS